MSGMLLDYAVIVFASIGFLVSVFFVGDLIYSYKRKTPDRMVTVVFLDENTKNAEGELRSLMYDLGKTMPAFYRGRVVAVDMGINEETTAIIQKLTYEYENMFYSTRENYLDVVKLLMEN
jgi:hypothetical protein